MVQHLALVAPLAVALGQSFLGALQGEGDDLVIPGGDVIQYALADAVLGQNHHGGKEHIIEPGVQVIGKGVGHDLIAVAQAGILHGKRIHAPGPVTIEKGAVFIGFKQHVGNGGFAHAGRTGDEDQLLFHGGLRERFDHCSTGEAVCLFPGQHPFQHGGGGVDILLGAVNARGDPHRAALQGAQPHVHGRGAMQAAAHGDAAGVKAIGDLAGIHALHGEAGDAHGGGVRVVEHPQPGETLCLAAETLVQPAFVLVDFVSVLPREANALQKPCDARQVQRAGFVPVRQKLRLEHALRGASGAAHHEGLRAGVLPKGQQAGSMGAQQPLMAGHGYHVGTERLGAHIQHPGGLGGVHQEGYAVFAAHGAQTGNGLDHPGDVAGVAAHHQAGAWRDAALQHMGLQDPHAVRRQDAQGDLALGIHALEQPHHSVVLRVGAQHLAAGLHRAGDGQVQRLCAIFGEDDLFRALHAKEEGCFLAAGLYHTACPQGRAVSAAAGVGAKLLQRSCHGADDLRRLGKAGGGVVKINHGENLLCTKWALRDYSMVWGRR